MSDIEETLQDTLSNLAENSKAAGGPGQYKSLYEFILKFGTLFPPRKLPKGYKRGTPKLCYVNSAHLAMTTHLIYVEGYGMTNFGLPVLHAWNIEPHSQLVVDVTSPNIVDYFGIPFCTEYVADRWEKEQEQAALIDNWQADFPLLQLSEKEMREVMWRPEI